jgi:hypothetical protein
MLHTAILAGMPVSLFDASSALPSALDQAFELMRSRSDLRRWQHNLRMARLNSVHHAIKYWEQRIGEALDQVWEAQEDFKCARRHWA